MTEACVTIDGVNLSVAEVMTLRVALGSFIIDLLEPDALGSDETGRATADNYMRHARRVEELLVQSANSRLEDTTE